MLLAVLQTSSSKQSRVSLLLSQSLFMAKERNTIKGSSKGISLFGDILEDVVDLAKYFSVENNILSSELAHW
jgi:hypothetical protein